MKNLYKLKKYTQRFFKFLGKSLGVFLFLFANYMYATENEFKILVQGEAIIIDRVVGVKNEKNEIKIFGNAFVIDKINEINKKDSLNFTKKIKNTISQKKKTATRRHSYIKEYKYPKVSKRKNYQSATNKRRFDIFQIKNDAVVVDLKNNVTKPNSKPIFNINELVNFNNKFISCVYNLSIVFDNHFFQTFVRPPTSFTNRV